MSLNLPPGVLDGPSVDELPEVRGKAPKLLLYPKKRSRIGDCRMDFELVSYDPELASNREMSFSE